MLLRESLWKKPKCLEKERTQSGWRWAFGEERMGEDEIICFVTIVRGVDT